MREPTQLSFQLQKPSRYLIGLMVLIVCLWLMFALGVNWGGAGSGPLKWLIGDSQGLLHGELWRLLSAPLIHDYKSPTHPLFVLMLLYFFAPPMEERWGSKRLFLFLFGSAAFAFVCESLIFRLAPSAAASRWYGGMVMADAVTVAWAFANRDQVVRLFFVLPVKPLMMVGFMIIWHIALLIVRSPSPEGMFAPFSAMLAGWLFCDSGPARRAYLKFKLRRLQSQVASMKRPKRKASASHLRVIKGGADDDEPPPDKSMLN